MYNERTLEALLKAEKLYEFDALDMPRALELGERLIADARALEDRPLAARVILDDNLIFQYLMPGTGADNLRWMERKCATVARTRHCSLLQAVLNELRGPAEPWQSDEFHYAFCGGGFPLTVNGVFRGIACVSGLPHLRDHQRLCDTLAGFLRQEKIRLPLEAQAC